MADTAMALACVVLVIGALWLFTRLYLRGPSLQRFDQPATANVHAADEPPSAALAEVLELLGGISAVQQGQSWRARLMMLRERLDTLGDEVVLDDIEIRPVRAGGVSAEWVIARGAEPGRRLLYLHGGAFAMGSPRSHRAITTELSRLAGTAVLAIDYRLIPEHRRLDGLADCQASYRWILENGPDGPSPLTALFVAGDSAGGNLTLATIAWARDAGLRAADAAVALSPATDATLSSPSILANLESDHMLGPQFGFLARLPSALVLWIAWLTARVRPCDPRVSPAHGDLSRLPPTLVHASEVEMLLDDARRYVNKARAAGSPAILETWPHMVHVWHIFHQRLPEGREALARIARFLEQQAPRTSRG